MDPDVAQAEPHTDHKRTDSSQEEEQVGNVFIYVRVALQEQEKIIKSMEKCGEQQSFQQRHLPDGRTILPEFRFAGKISHDYPEACMRRDGEEHPEPRGSDAKLLHIHDVLECCKAHADYHGVYNSIERFIETFSPVSVEAKDNKFYQFLGECHHDEGSGRHTGDAVIKGTHEEFFGDRSRHNHDCAKEEGKQEILLGLAVVCITMEDIQADGQARCYGERNEDHSRSLKINGWFISNIKK